MGRKTGRSKIPLHRRSVSLSACMMIRDEERNLPRCLNSIKDVVDEIVVVDTGSTDRSVEIVKSFGAKVYHHPWENDFSKHRNQSMSYASGNWLFIIDADEELLLQGAPSVIKQDLQRIPGEYPAAALLVEDVQKGHVVMRFNSARFFRKGRTRYMGIVHNQPVLEGSAVFLSSVRLNHYGYDLTPERKQAKFDRTTSLLFTRLKEDPTDYNLFFYLCQMYADFDQNEKCIEWGEKYLEHRDELDAKKSFNCSIYFTLTHTYMKLGRQEDAKRVLEKGRENVPKDLDLALAKTELGVWMGDSEMIISGAREFITLFGVFQRDPSAKGNRFIYSERPEALAYCAHYLTLAQMREGMKSLKILQSVLGHTKPEFKQGMLTELAEELRKLDVPIHVDYGQPQQQILVPPRQVPVMGAVQPVSIDLSKITLQGGLQ